MSWTGYRLVSGFLQIAFVPTVRVKAIRLDAIDSPGPLIIACSHLSHLDPFLLSVVLRHRQIDWMARIEFWKYRLSRRFLNWMDAIPVRRFGVAANSVRTAIERLRRGRVVGICPEGGVTQGKLSVMRGGPVKKGVCLISCRTGVPILPCVMLGTDRLTSVLPWLPFGNAKLWIAFGSRLIYPPSNLPDRRAARDLMAEELSREFQEIFREAKERFGLTEADVP